MKFNIEIDREVDGRWIADVVDLPGVILSSIGITALVYTVIEAPNWGWGSVHTAAGFAAAVVVLAAFALWERHTPHPLLDVSVFANRRFSGGSLAVTAGFLTLFGFIFVITQYFQFIKSYSAFETGVRLLPVAISIAVASIVGPRIVERIGTTAVVVAGLAIFAAGLAWASTADAATPYLEIATQMLMLGGGLGLTTAPATESIMGSLPLDKSDETRARLVSWRSQPGMLGLRWSFLHDPARRWLADGILDWLWAAADNLRIAAVTAVDCAESMTATRPIGKIQ